MEPNAAHEEQLKQGLLYAVRLLTVTKRSRQELAKRLSEKGYPAPVIQKVIEQLEQKGVLNDFKLIEGMVDRAIHDKRHGRSRIRLDLEQKKVDRALIEPALARYTLDEERANARLLAGERWMKLSRVEIRKRKKRLYDYLAGRGFHFDLCRQLVEELSRETHADL